MLGMRAANEHDAIIVKAQRTTISVLFAAIASLLIAGCGHQSMPQRGPVLRHDYMPAHWNYCGKACFLWVPDIWSVTVRDMVDANWTGLVDVDEAVYSACDRPKIWPDCWKDAHVR